MEMRTGLEQPREASRAAAEPAGRRLGKEKLGHELINPGRRAVQRRLPAADKVKKLLDFGNPG